MVVVAIEERNGFYQKKKIPLEKKLQLVHKYCKEVQAAFSNQCLSCKGSKKEEKQFGCVGQLLNRVGTPSILMDVGKKRRT